MEIETVENAMCAILVVGTPTSRLFKSECLIKGSRSEISLIHFQMNFCDARLAQRLYAYFDELSRDAFAPVLRSGRHAQEIGFSGTAEKKQVGDEGRV